MDLVTFIAHDSPSTLGKIFCFRAKESSSLIFQIFKKKFEKVTKEVTVLNSYNSPALLKAQLEMSFLGTDSVFWLHEDLVTDNLTSSALESYCGQNCIGYSSQMGPKPGVQGITIEVPHEVTYENFIHLFLFLYPEQSIKSASIIRQIFKIYSVVNINSAIVLMQYCMLVGSRSDLFLHEWLPIILNAEKSLFMLSSFLFAKKIGQFFHLWNLISCDYSEPFWTSYWSEQFFKATLFCSLMQDKKFAQAKKIAFKLPFSFMQKDWKVLRVDELKQAHDHLYCIDWNIKNGLSAHFEHFYLQFMLKKS